MNSIFLDIKEDKDIPEKKKSNVKIPKSRQDVSCIENIEKLIVTDI